MIKVSTKSVKIEADLTKEQETALLAMIAKLAIGNMEAGEEHEAPAQPQAPDAPPLRRRSTRRTPGVGSSLLSARNVETCLDITSELERKKSLARGVGTQQS